MPSMVDPYGARPFTTSLDSIPEHQSGGRANSLRLRLRTSVHRTKLTHALAEGADPGASDELALRAQQLTGDRYRKTLARSLRRSIAEARRPARTRGVASIIDRRAVLDAEGAIAELIEHLLGPRPVQPAGMAMVERILTNADRSPLYNPSEPGALRPTIRVATATLESQSAGSHQFTLSA
jgi:hypothetical protein